ncbi:alpha/beta hydrolase [Segetibacter sp. 3557_3]|uniref:alpha/beta hydrolase n=1 Tax=Segetibacter sp. 3557_3 TaxID=2547429 RepID=UPI001058C116|nr:alpha/beta hydrolase [Segetibacter sp. 3557_3]TDH27802.1 alpha/beta hydrolase [Segetibacter sp. 3557_3]
MKVYFIAGLGANEKAFGFLDLSFCEPVFISWIKPHPRETLAEYAGRLREVITDTDPIIVGVSFGGMLVTEMAKLDKSIRGIIISSNKTSKEFPLYLRMWRYLPVYKWVPGSVIKLSGRVSRKLIGPVGKTQQATFMKILGDTDPRFTVWAIHAILTWNNLDVPTNVVHIHGSSDRLLPMRFVKPDHVISKGKHLMIMDRAEELSALLKKLVQNL